MTGILDNLVSGIQGKKHGNDTDWTILSLFQKPTTAQNSIHSVVNREKYNNYIQREPSTSYMWENILYYQT